MKINIKSAHQISLVQFKFKLRPKIKDWVRNNLYLNYKFLSKILNKFNQSYIIGVANLDFGPVVIDPYQK